MKRLILVVVVAAACVPVRGQTPIDPAKVPPSLRTALVPVPPNLGEFVQDQQKLIQLGKALYWDMQVGSDGLTACATCHFHAGADNRNRGQINPGSEGSFHAGVGPNSTLATANFPFHKLADPNQVNSEILQSTNDVMGSAGVPVGTFNPRYLRRGLFKELLVPLPGLDPLFQYDGRNLRRNTGRNAPTNINAVFNFHNFWDGRAHNVFNGLDPFGPSNPRADILVNVDNRLEPKLIRIPLASLASQSVGPVTNDVEMSFTGRTWPDVGKRLVYARPLLLQLVHPEDSVLGPLSNARLVPAIQYRLIRIPPRLVGGTGLRVPNYQSMIQQAFRPEYWNSRLGIRILPDGTREPLNRPARLGDEYQQIEANFSLFFALALHAFQSTLISDDTPFDRYAAGNRTALTARQLQGLAIFTNEGNCIACHFGPELTSAGTSVALGLAAEPAAGYTADLGGQQLTPPVQTQAIGIAEIEVVPNRASIGTRVDVIGATNVTGIQVRLGFAGQDGPVLWTLYDSATDGAFNRVVLKALTQANLRTTPAIQFFTQAADAVRAGQTYILVQTQANPNGEVRGQIVQAAEGLIERMAMTEGFANYDTGYYNIGHRPSGDDLGRGGSDPFGLPLSFVARGLLKRDGQLPPGLAPYTPDLPFGPTSPPDRIAVRGAFKAPGLRNVELTGPYLHNGSMATLHQVVDIYVRGGNFPQENIDDLAPIIKPIPLLQGREDLKDALVDFLLALTDERVRQERAPFDHPQLFVPEGHTTEGRAGFLANLRAARATPGYGMRLFNPIENVRHIPAVGAAGRPQMEVPPLERFLNLDPFQE